MKKRLLLLAGTALFLWSSINTGAQTSPFAAKSVRPAGTAPVGFMPKPLLPIPGVSVNAATKSTRLVTARPVSRPLPPPAKSPSCFSGRHVGVNGQLIFISGTLPDGIRLDQKSAGSEEAACFQYLEALQGELRIRDARSEFIISKSLADEKGLRHIRLQQVYRGIPVYGAEIWLHAQEGRISQFNGNPYPTPGFSDVNPILARNQAELTAILNVSSRTTYGDLSAAQKATLGYNGPAGELVIYAKDRDPRQMHLAWHITIRPNFLERWEYFVDANTGSVIHAFNNTQTDGGVTATGPDLNGVNRTINAYLEGSNYLMVDVTRPMFNPQNFEGTLRVYDANYTSPSQQGFNPAICSSAGNTWGPKVISAQYNAGVTYDYYRNVHGKNSWNNQGASILSVINATEDNGSGMDNAYWNGVCIVYGNGDTYFKPLAGALDVSAHELGHAFDEGSANLEYQSQSGAMNEAFADISGAMVERLNWKIGEDVVKPGAFPTGCLRDMSNPHNGGSSLGDPGYQPASVSEMYNGTDDNGGVHINSGIINFAFYKMATAVGVDKAEKSFFKALFNYLTRSSQFIDCRLAVVQSAKDLYGDGSAEMNAAKTAFDEVGINDGSGGNYQNPLPVNPGPDFILSHDLAAGAQYSLYISPANPTTFQPVSQTILKNKPSILDNGSAAVFVGNDKMIHAIGLSSPYQETIIENEAIWSNVAISKDGSMIAAVTEYQDSAIYLYSYAKQSWAKAHLYNPTTQQGVVTNNVLYADGLEWDYSGNYIIYDAYNQMNSSSTGQNVDYWDISYMEAWNSATGDWGSGEIYKLITGIPEGVSIGNMSLSKNSPSVCAFDYMDGNNGNSVMVMAANLESGDFADVFNNGTTLSYPNYSKLDDKIIFTADNSGTTVVADIAMQADKIHPVDGNAYVFINEAKWGVWYAQGTRTLGVPEPVANNGFRAYPNPATDLVSVTFERPVNETVTVEVFDIRGSRVLSSAYLATDRINVGLGSLPQGIYLLKATGNSISGTAKIIKK